MFRGATLREVFRLAARAAGLILAALLVAPASGQTVISGTYDGVTIAGDISVAANTSATFTGGTTFTGTNATFGVNAALTWQQTGTLAGKTLISPRIFTAGENNALTLASTTNATGTINISANSNATSLTNLGTITHTVGAGSIGAGTFTNSGSITASNGGRLVVGTEYGVWSSTNTASGTITADGAGSLLTIAGAFFNQGTVTAQNSGSIRFTTSSDYLFPTANLGKLQIASGGHIYLSGYFDNTSATLTAPIGGQFELSNGTIINGTVNADALTFAPDAVSGLSNVTFEGNLTLPADAFIILSGGTTFSGPTITLGSRSRFYWRQSDTLSDRALSFSEGAYMYLDAPDASLTLGATTTATGNVQIRANAGYYSTIINQGTITHDTGSGALDARTLLNTGRISATSGSSLSIGNGTSTTTTNGSGGTILSDGLNSTVSLNGSIVNNGTLIAQNSGRLVFGFYTGYYPIGQTTANLGTILIATGGHVYFSGTLDNTSTTLTAPSGGTFELYGGSIYNGTIASGALTFTNLGGTLSHVELTGNVSLPGNSIVSFADGTTLNGASVTFGNSSRIDWRQIGSITNSALTFNGGSLNIIGANALTIDSKTIATGNLQIYSDGTAGSALTNQGTLTQTGSYGQVYASSFLNSGLITASSGGYLLIGNGYRSYGITNTSSGVIKADGAPSVIELQGNVINQGTLVAQNGGTLYFGRFNGSQTTANLGAVQALNGGHAYLNSTVDNTGATLTGGPFELSGGTINNGTIAPGTLSFTNYAGVLNNVVLNDNLTLPTNAGVTFTGGTTFTGSTATLGASSGLGWGQNGVLSGKSISFAPGAHISILANSLTLDRSTTLTGQVSVAGESAISLTNQGTITHNLGIGMLYAATFLNSSSITASLGSALTIGNYYTSTMNGAGGVIIADGSNTSVFFNGQITNQGSIIAQNGAKLTFLAGYGPAQTTADLGTIQIASGGHVYLAGIFNNTGATLAAPTGGSYELYAGTINNGTVASGALTYTGGGGTLNNVSLVGDFTLPDSARANFSGGTTFSGANMTLSDSSSLGWLQSGTLDGKALNFGTGSALTVGAGNSLTLGPSIIATGAVSVLGGSGSTITNQGAIKHAGVLGNLSAQTITNSGNITVTGGALMLTPASPLAGSTFTNSAGGLIRTEGYGQIGPPPQSGLRMFNNGMIEVRGGTLFTDDQLTNGAGGTISGGGIIRGGLVMAGGTLAPGNGVGTLTVANGALNITGASVFAVELGGASSDQLVFDSPPSTVSLGTGLLTLSLTLLAPPTEGTTYSLIRISSGGSGITGTFAGLPASGSTINAVYADTTYTFGVNYATNLVSLNFATIPEPSTYVLLGAGAVLLALWRRRR